MIEKMEIPIISKDHHPQNRKDIFIMWEEEITKAIVRRDIGGQIRAIKNQIITALPEIPEKEYERKSIFMIKPSYEDVKREYFKVNDILIPEMASFHQHHILRMQNEKYLDLLEWERLIVVGLLKTHTNWYFSDEKQPTTTR